MKIKSGGAAAKPAPKKKASVAPKKAAAAVKKATYQVPAKLKAPTAANKKAGMPTLASVLKKQDNSIAKFNAEKKKAAQKPGTKGEVKKVAKKPAGKLDEMAQGNKALKQLWNKKNRLNSK